MTIRGNSARDRQARLLAEDPGRYDPATAFRVAEYLSDSGEIAVDAHDAIQPTPVAIGGFRRDHGRVAIKSALAPLVGPLGALPPAYNDLLQRQRRNRSGALASFLNLFAVRLSELFVAATEKYRLARRMRWSRTPDDDAFVKTLLSLTGFGTAGLAAQAGVNPDVLLRFSGFFADRTRNAANLAAMLGEFTGLPIRIQQFRRRWVSLPVHEQSRMSRGGGVRLGTNSTAGAAIADAAGGFRVVIGPVGYADYVTLSPGTARLAEIAALTRLFVGTGLHFDVQVVLRKEDIPFCRMGSGEVPPRLGWNSWARVAPATRDSGDAILTEAQAIVVAVGG